VESTEDSHVLWEWGVFSFHDSQSVSSSFLSVSLSLLTSLSVSLSLCVSLSLSSSLFLSVSVSLCLSLSSSLFLSLSLSVSLSVSLCLSFSPLSGHDDSVEVFDWKFSNYFFQWSSSEQIAMGGGGGQFGFVLGKDLLQAETNPCETFGNPHLTTHRGVFDVLEVEVWGFESHCHKRY
jgi:hypothetical protein